MQPPIVNQAETDEQYRARVLRDLWLHLHGFSNARFATYQAAYGNAALANYFWNVRVCESLIPTLNATEIMLKNAINAVLAKKHGDCWYDAPNLLEAREVRSVAKAKEDALKPDGNGGDYLRGPDDVIAELGFGFWTSLLRPEYSKTIWNQLLIGGAFPGIPDIEDKRHKIRGIFANACDLRNRVCHHERVVHLSDIEERVKAMRLGIRWISKPYGSVVSKFCRFDEVWAEGPEHSLDRLQAIIPPR